MALNQSKINILVRTSRIEQWLISLTAEAEAQHDYYYTVQHFMIIGRRRRRATTVTATATTTTTSRRRWLQRHLWWHACDDMLRSERWLDLILVLILIHYNILYDLPSKDSLQMYVLHQTVEHSYCRRTNERDGTGRDGTSYCNGKFARSWK